MLIKDLLQYNLPNRTLICCGLVGISVLSGCSSIQFRDGSILNRPDEASDKSEQTGSQKKPTKSPEQTQQGSPTSGSNGSQQAAQVRLSPDPYLGSSDFTGQRRQDQVQLLKRNLQLINSNKLDQAQQQLSNLPPELQNSAVHYQMGLIQNRRNKPNNALKAFQKAYKLNNKNVYALNQIGIIYRKNGYFDQSRAAYQQALKIWPHYLTAWYNLGVLEELYFGNNQAALSAYKRYLLYAQAQARTTQSPPKELRLVDAWVKDLERRTAR